MSGEEIQVLLSDKHDLEKLIGLLDEHISSLKRYTPIKPFDECLLYRMKAFLNKFKKIFKYGKNYKPLDYSILIRDSFADLYGYFRFQKNINYQSRYLYVSPFVQINLQEFESDEDYNKDKKVDLNGFDELFDVLGQLIDHFKTYDFELPKELIIRLTKASLNIIETDSK